MLEAVLYFVLGFLSAGLLALMVSPAIWNRAVVLTKRRIESSVPLTLNEIQADKDQLRAEFAMSTRRLEMSVEELREKASSQVIEINRKRDELAKLTEDSEERLSTVQQLEAKASELRAQLQEREEKIDEITSRHKDVESKLEAGTLELEELKSNFAAHEDKLNGQRIELVARDATIDNLNDTLSALSIEGKQKPAEITSLKRKLSASKTKLDNEKQKYKELQERLIQTKKQYADATEKLERRERDLNRARKTASSDDATSTELTRQLVDEKERIVELEAKLAAQVLKTEALLSDASNENVQHAMASVKEDLDKATAELKKTAKERDKLSKQLAAIESKKGTDWEAERRDNAILRERINDMAAQVTAMTAALEGEKSPINEILGTNGKGTKAKSKSRKTAKSADPQTLADRIRALQDASSSGR